MINTPSYFRIIFRAVSAFMPKSALEKVPSPPDPVPPPKKKKCEKSVIG
jgi:hypothetical protein